jgi:hypothetical protein
MPRILVGLNAMGLIRSKQREVQQAQQELLIMCNSVAAALGVPAEGGVNFNIDTGTITWGDDSGEEGGME